MLDIKILRETPEKVRNGVAAKRTDPALVDAFLELDKAWRDKTSEADQIKMRQNQIAKQWGSLNDVEKEEAKSLKEKVRELDEAVRTLEEARALAWVKLPNLPSDDTPIGEDESGNQVIRKWGEPRQFNFEPKDHVALGEALHIIDTERAAKVSGSRFGYLMGDAAMLEFALVQLALDTLRDEAVLRNIADEVAPGYPDTPFIPVVPPVMIRPEVYKRTARLDPGQEEERYYLPADDLYLIGSAEHTLAPLHMDEVIKEERLPIRYVGFSTSFRREAGSYGKDTTGILRVHQFDKVEMESFVRPEDSVKEQEFFVRIQEHLLQALGIPYQVVFICTGDMGAPDYRQIDIECWLPGQNRYRETHSADLVTDYQARRLHTRMRRLSGDEELVHMNDATVFAIGRMLIAILENYQTKEGGIEIPKVLQKYVGETAITA